MKRLMVFGMIAGLALAVAPARADATYEPKDFKAGPQGGDGNNQYFVDPSTGSVTVVRHQLLGISGGLGCGGSGPFAYLQVDHAAEGTVQKVTASFEDAVIDPYTFLAVHVRQGDHFLGSRAVRGPILDAGSLELDLAAMGTAAPGPVTIWFGIQVSSACPNVDGGTVRFTSLSVDEA